jgi:hypothetical protein
MTSKLCIMTFVSGKDYQDYIPLYIFSIQKAYPDYDITIFLDEPLAVSVRESLEYLRNFGHFKIIENYFPYWPKNCSRRAISKMKRWLIFSPDVYQYEYIYIGDVDILIIKEDPSLLEQHIIHSELINLSYSNVLRRTDNKRMTGLLFVKTKPFYEKFLPIIEKYKEKIINDEFNPSYESDEYLLYQMIEESGLGLCPQATEKGLNNPHKKGFRPHHGVHLAVFRNLLPDKAIVNSPSFIHRVKSLQNVIKDPLFKKIESKIQSKMVKRVLNRLMKVRVDY